MRYLRNLITHNVVQVGENNKLLRDLPDVAAMGPDNM